MVDLLFLSHNRRAFTEKTLQVLELNTDWSSVGSIHCYDDMSTDGAYEVVQAWAESMEGANKPVNVLRHHWGGPVAIMNHFIGTVRPELFAKIDSDTCVPAGWLNVALRCMAKHPEVDLLGIEALTQPIVAVEDLEGLADPDWKSYAQDFAIARGVADHRFIGGIGLMKGKPFYEKGRLSPSGAGGRFGFTSWQEQHPCKKGFIQPSLPVVLLDHLPIEPWASLSSEYVDKGWQRPWPPYTAQMKHDLWGWIERT